MKFRLAAVLVVLIIGSLVWLSTTRRSEPVAKTNPDASPLTKQTGRLLAVPAIADTIVPEGNPEVPEEASDVLTNSVLPQAVAAKPRTVALASVEDPPPAPDMAESSASVAPVTALENMRAVFRQYTLRFGGNPVGDNSEITAVLNGRNPRQAVFLNPDDGMRLNERGELVDSWGTPYFFHQLSRTEMEIHSAGPDRKLWTSDDLVMK